jgi:hypothetical protein
MVGSACTERWRRGLTRGETRSSSFPFKSLSSSSSFRRILVLFASGETILAMAGEVVFGSAVMQLGQRESWVLHELDNPEQQ